MVAKGGRSEVSGYIFAGSALKATHSHSPQLVSPEKRASLLFGQALCFENFLGWWVPEALYIRIYIYICLCVSVYVYIHIYIYVP